MGDGSGLDARCGGSGILYCYCGGDSCCCDFHGYAECYGCPDCDGDPCDDDFYDDDPVADRDAEA